MAEERYEIIKLLGKGRTGGVYEAEDTNLTRKVAMRRFFCQSSTSDVSEHVDEFVAVAQSLSALQHPNLLRVFDAGVDDDGAFIISQLLKGDTVHNRLKEGALPLSDVYDLAQQLLDALSSAHHAGFVHGAITPGSILMTPRARGGFLYVILDMGLSRLAPLIQGKDSILSMMADPAILAPELFDGSTADEQADLYMVGHILYMCLAGGHPFAGNPLEECEVLHRAGLPALEEFAPDTPVEFISWINWLCQIQPSDRPSDVAEAIATLPKIDTKPKTAVAPIQPSAHATGIHTIPPTTVPGTFIPGTANPATQPFNATGPLTGFSPAPTSQGILPASEKKKSKTWIYIASGVVGLAAIIGIIVASGGKDEKDDTAADEEEKTQQNSVADAPKKRTPTPKKPTKRTHPGEHLTTICGYLALGEDGTEEQAISPENNGWRLAGKSAQSATAEGWKMSYVELRKQPLLMHPLTHSNSNDLYDLGWRMSYKVQVHSGGHMIGWNLSKLRNSGWLDEDKAVSIMLIIQRVGDEVIIRDVTDKSKKYSLKLDPASALDLVIEGRPDDADGKFLVRVNGKRAWTHKLNQVIAIKGASNSVLCLPNITQKLDAQQPNHWTVKSLKLETLRKP